MLEVVMAARVVSDKSERQNATAPNLLQTLRRAGQKKDSRMLVSIFPRRKLLKGWRMYYTHGRKEPCD